MKPSVVKIIPNPQIVKESDEPYWHLAKDFEIAFRGDRADEVAELLAEYLEPMMQRKIPLKEGTSAQITIEVKSKATFDNACFTDESYILDTTGEVVRIIAETYIGALRGIQSFRQILPSDIYMKKPWYEEEIDWILPSVRIEDAPRFRWRGLHLDVSRHFFSVDEVKRFVELAAQHKYNIFHWHLTDDQGWRIEIKKYPKLTEVGSWREKTLIGHDHWDKPRKFDNTPHGGFYTQDEIRDVVAFAAKRGITVVPEIDMPGHMSAAIASYPELGNGFNANTKVRCHWGIAREVLNMEESTLQFCKDVWSELFDLFPSKFFHIGGDEAPRDEWSESERAQELMAERGFKSEAQLQAWFTKSMNEFFKENGRRLIGWDEILEGGIDSSCAIMSWRGDAGGIAGAKAGHDVVMAPNSHTYFDHYQDEPVKEEPLAIGGMLTTSRVYSFDVIPKDLSSEEAKHILGGQGQLWTEYIATMSHLEYMVYPRASALAEVLWSLPERKSYEDFLYRLQSQRERFLYQEVNAHRRP